MSCHVFKQCPMTFEEAMRASGHELRPDTPPSRLAEVITSDGLIFMCGALKPESLCPCGHPGDFLCDWPVGDGKTCDLPLCKCCANVIGEDRHACEIHWHVFKQQTGVARMFPKGPRLVRAPKETPR